MVSRHQQVSQQETKTAQKPQREAPSMRTAEALAQYADPFAIQRAMAEPRLMTPADVQTLQRTVGNRAVRCLIQPKLMVGPVDDQYEQEADQAGERVMSMPPPAHSEPVLGTTSAKNIIQRFSGNPYLPTTDLTHPALEHMGLKDLGPYKFRPMQGEFEYTPPNIAKEGPIKFLQKLLTHQSDAENYSPEKTDIVGGFEWLNPSNNKKIKFHPAGIKHAEKQARIDKAKETYEASEPGKMRDAIRKFDKGQTPRQFTSVDEEDNLGAAQGAHIVARHVVGGAEMPNQKAVAVRAAFGLVGGINGHGAAYSPIASAFKTKDDANAEIKNAIKKELEPNWTKYRYQLLAGKNIELKVARSGRDIVAYRSVKNAMWEDGEKPAFLGAFPGKRPLYHPDPDWDDWASHSGLSSTAIEQLKQGPLTVDVSGTLAKIHVRILSSTEDNTGGWFVHSAYPTN